jgi:uncharacterized membrane protein
LSGANARTWAIAGAVAAAAVAGAAVFGPKGPGRTRMSELREGDGRIRVRHAVRIDRPVDEVYRYWRELGNAPKFMRNIVSVEDLGLGRSRWVARGPAGTQLTWISEITEDLPDELLTWRSLPGGDIENRGGVRFLPAPAGRGTEVILEVHYTPPAGAIGWAAAKVLGVDPADQAREDLRTLRQLLETGEIPRVDPNVRGGHPRVSESVVAAALGEGEGASQTERILEETP